MPAPLAYRAVLDSIIVSFPGALATAAFWRATGSVSRLQQASALSPVRALSDGPSGGMADSLDEAKAAFRAAWDTTEMKKPRGVLRNESSQSEAHTEIPLCAPVRLAEICRVSRRSSC
jgi:hypothetical protein